jgi:hypothetical protein
VGGAGVLISGVAGERVLLTANIDLYTADPHDIQAMLFPRIFFVAPCYKEAGATTIGPYRMVWSYTEAQIPVGVSWVWQLTKASTYSFGVCVLTSDNLDGKAYTQMPAISALKFSTAQ